MSHPLTKEEDFVDITVNKLGKIYISGGGDFIETRSAKMHRTPKATFPNCSPALFCPLLRREICDLVFVYKHFTRNKLDAKRAVLVQAKYTGGNRKTWLVETGQFCLLRFWPPFKIISPAKFSNVYHLVPKTRTWSTYCFVGPRASKYPLYFSAKRLHSYRPDMLLNKHSSITLRRGYKFDYSGSFLLKFVQGLLGEDLFFNSSISRFIDDLYKMVGLKPDPPEEFEWSTIEGREDKVFGVIEFVVTSQTEK